MNKYQTETYEFMTDEWDNAIITKYLGEEGNVEIPSSLWGHPVTAIAANAFCRREHLQTVHIPASVYAIGIHVSENCYPPVDKKPDIVWNPFPHCSALSAITVSPENKNYMDMEGVLYSRDKTKIIAFPAGKEAASYRMPDSVRIISGFAFLDCVRLKTIHFPEMLDMIGVGAFENCSALKDLELPPKLRRIKCEAFILCASLESIVIPSSVAEIEEAVFSCCKALKRITVDKGNKSFRDIEGVLYSWDRSRLIAFPSDYPSRNFVIPPGTQVFEAGAFWDTELESVSIPEGVSGIQGVVFSGCKLKRVSLPRSLKTVSNDNFNSAALETVEYAGSMDEWEEIEIDKTNSDLFRCQRNGRILWESEAKDQWKEK